jgi:tetratricopeptide (TPR) repeat protein
MYGREPADALHIFAEILEDLSREYSPEKLEQIGTQKKLPPEQIKRLCQVAGRCHNNIGYIYWMNTGQYWLALTEFQKAIAYFELAGLAEEQANSLDNMGRVYAVLGSSWDSFTAIQDGLRLRREQVHLPYREALSLTSLALHYIQFDKLHDAIETVGEALTIFRQVGIERGEALALIARGEAFRVKAESWRDQRATLDQALADLETADADLRGALRIFAGTVEEPLRRVHVENELACCYRARYLLLKEKEGNEKEKQDVFTKGLRFFKSANALAEEAGFLIEKMDNLQDRAVLYERAGDYDHALEDLEQVRQQIPKDHKFMDDQEVSVLPSESRIYAYYKIMGKVELLHGAIIYARGQSSDPAQGASSSKILLEMMEHYILAVAYFNTFAGHIVTNRQTHDRIYRRLKRCDKTFLINLREQEIPRWIERYHLPADAVQISINEIFRLLLPFGS